MSILAIQSKVKLMFSKFFPRCCIGFSPLFSPPGSVDVDDIDVAKPGMAESLGPKEAR